MSTTFTKLFASITESTIWAEPHTVRIVWITMLAMADRHGRVWASIPGLANRARVTLEDCEDALNRFQKPDKYSRTPDFEGRRIEPIDGGWRLLNHAKYRAIRDEESALEAKRKYAAKKRSAQRDESPGKVDKVDQSRSEANTVDRSRDNAEAEAEAEAEKTPLPPEGGTPGKPGELLLGVPEAKKQGKPPEDRNASAKKILRVLNELSRRSFREIETNFTLINARLAEKGVTEDGVMAMVRRQCDKWKDDVKMCEFLRPETLFGKEKFEGYYSARDLPLEKETRETIANRLRSMPGWPNHIGHSNATEADKAAYATLLARYKAMPE